MQRVALAPAELVWVAQPGRALIVRSFVVRSGAVFEAPTLVAGFDDVAVVSWASSIAVVIFGSPNTLGHSPKARLVVTTIEVRS